MSLKWRAVLWTLSSLIIAQIWHLVERFQNTTVDLSYFIWLYAPPLGHWSILHVVIQFVKSLMFASWHGNTVDTKAQTNNCFPIFITIICTSRILLQLLHSQTCKEKDDRLEDVHWHKTSHHQRQGHLLSTPCECRCKLCVWTLMNTDIWESLSTNANICLHETSDKLGHGFSHVVALKCLLAILKLIQIFHQRDYWRSWIFIERWFCKLQMT